MIGLCEGSQKDSQTSDLASIESFLAGNLDGPGAKHLKAQALWLSVFLNDRGKQHAFRVLSKDQERLACLKQFIAMAKKKRASADALKCFMKRYDDSTTFQWKKFLNLKPPNIHIHLNVAILVVFMLNQSRVEDWLEQGCQKGVGGFADFAHA